MSQYKITKNPQFEGADDFDFALKHKTFWIADDCLAKLNELTEGMSWGYAPGIVKLADGTRLNKKYNLVEALELAEKHPEVKAITWTRALSEGTAVRQSWFSLRGSCQVMTGEKSEAKEEITWIKEI